jgi:hypothetical protein
VRLLGEERAVLVVAAVTRHQRNVVLRHQALGGGLRAHGLDAFGIRADEHDAGVDARPRKPGVLRQESVARMDRLRAGFLRDVDDHVAAQVRLVRTWPADRPCLVGEADVLRVPIGFGVHRDAVDAEPAAGADHPAGDLAAIGDQDTLEHYSPSQ